MKAWSDLVVLYNLWLKPMKRSKSHQERLESFYKQQASHYDSFRERFLHGRDEMLKVASAHLSNDSQLVWIDMGGGTGENVLKMLQFIPRERFKTIHIVDLCPSLCMQAQKKMQAHGLDDLVTVTCADACTFAGCVDADLITFSYSLSMIPPFHEAVRTAKKLLKEDGIVAVVDFAVSSKFDHCYRQMSWASRFFWRSVFDLDAIDIGPERRQYLDLNFHCIYEQNNRGTIPYVPSILKAPYYVWIGNKTGKLKHVVAEHKEAPIKFPPTFLYHQSWEDPEEDKHVLNINEHDVVLTLTAGGCNSLHLLLEGAKQVVSVDVNPAQNALLELKQVAVQELDYEDVWLLFGEGKHPNFDEIYERKLSPFLSETARRFWNEKRYYFKDGLYLHGSMGKVTCILQRLFYVLGMTSTINAMLACDSIDEQARIWDSTWCARHLFASEDSQRSMFATLLRKALFNDASLWYGGGVPVKQAELIHQDGLSIVEYLGRCIMGVIHNSLISKENYFWYNILVGKYCHENCPPYLTHDGYAQLRTGILSRLMISTNYFLEELKSRQYTKVDLMDHADWQSPEQTHELVTCLWNQVASGGKIIFRSAALEPPYVQQMRDIGFVVRCISDAKTKEYQDRVNMYASFWVATKP